MAEVNIYSKLEAANQKKLIAHLKSLPEKEQKLLEEDLRQFNFDDVKTLYELSQQKVEVEKKSYAIYRGNFSKKRYKYR